MKGLLITTNLICIGIIIWLMMHKLTPGSLMQKQTPITSTGKPGSVNDVVCTDCNNETDGQIFSHFKNVVYNYRTEHWDLINQYQNQVQHRSFDLTAGLPSSVLQAHNSTTDSRCIWFPLETIKKFLCTIEKYNNKLKTPNKELGVRLYYAVYEPDYSDASKQNRHTIFMVPTYQAVPGAQNPQIDFDPRETYNRQTQTQGRFQEMVNFVMLGQQNGAPQYASTRRLILAPEESNLVQNTGQICPTNCPVPNTFTVIDP